MGGGILAGDGDSVRPGRVLLPPGVRLAFSPKAAGTGAKAVRAGFGPRGVAVTDTTARPSSEPFLKGSVQ